MAPMMKQHLRWIRVVKASGGGEVVRWTGDGQTADGDGLICDKELAERQGGA